VIDTPARTTTQASLAGRGIVITRPRERSGRLVALIREAGGRPVVFPALEIVDPVDSRSLRVLIERLEHFDIAVFISPTAAAKGLACVHARREWPVGLRAAAIGKGTARELRRLGVDDIIVPAEGADTEALLAMAQFQAMQSKAVVIFRGTGGREVLADTLRRGGATVEYAECYRRARPSGDAQMLLRAWGRGELHATTATSREALDNLVEMVGTLGRHWLRKTPMFVSHERIATAARAHGIVEVHVAPSGDEALLEAMARYFATTP
jgi:uroporphyrinogen-III synthase